MPLKAILVVIPMLIKQQNLGPAALLLMLLCEQKNSLNSAKGAFARKTTSSL
ncbi:hypothetical protein CLV59_103240 [Chitinophaga dinghuensis]|uniref:Uncharacterized protein n=1 Tax=Chitinophaga dinghuensis TaxID=1539050 RepID=A0A327W4I1_9BACT|nr:hypothetical protein CLV59_103240 [Chitinophaga dinghuensis]